MDCLPVSGLLRIFCAKKITISSAISSMYVFVPEIIEYTVHGEVATELTKSGKSRIYDHRHDPGYTDEEEKIRFVDL